MTLGHGKSLVELNLSFSDDNNKVSFIIDSSNNLISSYNCIIFAKKLVY